VKSTSTTKLSTYWVLAQIFTTFRTHSWIGFTWIWLRDNQSNPLTSWSTGGVVKQHLVREILVRGVTSPCWLSLKDLVLQGTRSISYPRLLMGLSTWSKASI
jgi:hypothetical protein